MARPKTLEITIPAAGLYGACNPDCPLFRSDRHVRFPGLQYVSCSLDYGEQEIDGLTMTPGPCCPQHCSDCEKRKRNTRYMAVEYRDRERRKRKDSNQWLTGKRLE